MPARGQVGVQVSQVPSQANGFAGLPRGTKVVVVQPGDCLSVLAERHLGDWRLDTEIEALNWGRLQPDGRALIDDHWIYVGWVLVMPPNAVGTLVVGQGTPGPTELNRSGHVAAASTSHQRAEAGTATTETAAEPPGIERHVNIGPTIPSEGPREGGRSAPATAAAHDARRPESACSTPDGPAHLDTPRPHSGHSAPHVPVRSATTFGESAHSGANAPPRPATTFGESAHSGANAPANPVVRVPESAQSAPAAGTQPVPQAHHGPRPGPREPGPPRPDDGHSSTGQSGDADAAAAEAGGPAAQIATGDRSSAEAAGASGLGAGDDVSAGGSGRAVAHGVTRNDHSRLDATNARGLGTNPAGGSARLRNAGDEGRNVIDLGVAAGIGAIAGAGLVWRLDRSRREQNHRRPKGSLIRRNRPEVEAAERCVRAIASEDAMRWVDYGIRYLSGLIERLALDNQGPVPSLALVRVGGCGLEIVLSPPVNGSLGWFTPVRDGTALVLDADITLEELEALGADRWTVWPALVSLGVSEDDVLLLNLEHAGSLSVEGPDDLVQGVLGRLVLELSSQPWSDEMLSGVYMLGEGPLDERLPVLHGVPVAEAEELAEKLGRISASHQELAGPFALAGLRALACEALPNIAVAFTGTPARVLEQLAESAVPDQSGLAIAGAGPIRARAGS